MRTTITLDDQIAKSLQEYAHLNRQSFKEVVNQALSLGLNAMEQAPSLANYRLKTVSMGKPRPGINIDKALDWANRQEDDAIANKLDLCK